ncbi:MAG: J domain-containing protein [Bacteriovoracia bacterium]
MRINVPPHELLGVPLDATQAEIKRAYKRLMKQYHPDSVAAPGTSQWQEAQKIAAALNEAKETLLKTAKR